MATKVDPNRSLVLSRNALWRAHIPANAHPVRHFRAGFVGPEIIQPRTKIIMYKCVHSSSVFMTSIDNYLRKCLSSLQSKEVLAILTTPYKIILLCFTPWNTSTETVVPDLALLTLDPPCGSRVRTNLLYALLCKNKKA